MEEIAYHRDEKIGEHAEQTGIEAKTIHRLLEADPKNGGFKRNAENPLDCDLFVVDETSMVDTSLVFAVMKAVPPKSGLLLVGDVDQLPSVGPGQILGDIIGWDAIEVARLTEVFDQAAESRIVVNAHRINGGEMPEWPKQPLQSPAVAQILDAAQRGDHLLTHLRAVAAAFDNLEIGATVRGFWGCGTVK